jgi:hypothetical protein
MSNIPLKPRNQLSPRERDLVARLHQFLNDPGLLRASFVRMRRRCGKASCRCASEKGYRHESVYVIQRHQGKPRMKHLGRDQEDRVYEWVERYHRIKTLLNNVSDLYWRQLGKV